jgi:hypothetical protein
MAPPQRRKGVAARVALARCAAEHRSAVPRPIVPSLAKDGPMLPTLVDGLPSADGLSASCRRDLDRERVLRRLDELVEAQDRLEALRPRLRELAKEG